MEKKLEDVAIYHIMTEDELQNILDKVNRGESFTSLETMKLLRQVLHWKDICEQEQENVKFLLRQREATKNKREMEGEVPVMSIANVMSKDCNVSEQGVNEFHQFAMEEIFNNLPSSSTCELTNAFTTFSSLQMRYLIQVPNRKNAFLSFILHGAKALGNKDKIHQDYLRADFAFLNENRDKQLSGVRVFEENTDEFKNIFEYAVLPKFQEL